MPVNLSIKNVPDDIVEQLRRRAARHHRSLQGELMTIIEQSVQAPERLSAEEVLARVREMGIQTPAEGTEMIRADRNAR